MIDIGKNSKYLSEINTDSISKVDGVIVLEKINHGLACFFTANGINV